MEVAIVADGSIERGYSYKNALRSHSALWFINDALTKAGWDVDQAALDSGTISAHYSKNGRNLSAISLRTREATITRVTVNGKERST